MKIFQLKNHLKNDGRSYSVTSFEELRFASMLTCETRRRELTNSFFGCDYRLSFRPLRTRVKKVLESSFQLVCLRKAGTCLIYENICRIRLVGFFSELEQ